MKKCYSCNYHDDYFVCWFCPSERCAVEDASPTKINIEAVEQALKEIKADKPDDWLSAFETRVNEIYEGDGVVSVTSRMEDNKLKVTGYVEKNNEDGFQSSDEEIFAIEQTGDANATGTPATITSYTDSGTPVVHQSSFASTMFQYWLISRIFAPNYSYHTPAARVSSLNGWRNTYRSSPAFTLQKAANQSYQSKRPAVLNRSPSAPASKNSFRANSIANTQRRLTGGGFFKRSGGFGGGRKR